MAEKSLEFMKSPKENLQTWDMVWKLMIGSGAATLLFLLILGLAVL